MGSNGLVPSPECVEVSGRPVRAVARLSWACSPQRMSIPAAVAASVTAPPASV